MVSVESLYRTRAARTALFLVMTVVLLGLQPAGVLAHSAFLGSSPEPGERLDSSPSGVVLTFTEPLNQKLSRASLASVRSGKKVPAVLKVTSGSRFIITPRVRLARGPYRVEWHSVSTEDGHALEGSFSFGVRAAATGSEHAVEQSPLARDGWLRVLARSFQYALMILFVGALFLRALIRTPHGSSWLLPNIEVEGIDNGRAARRERSLLLWLGPATVVAAVVAVVVEAADAAGGISPSGLRDFLLTNLPGLARLSVVVLIAAAWLLTLMRSRLAWVPAAAALGGIAISGHANSASPRIPAVLTDWVHLLAGTVWLGGIALIVIVWWPTLRRAKASERSVVARKVLPAFGRVALPAFLLTVTAGLINAVTELGHIQALWESTYGQVLLVKIALVALIAVASYFHVYRLRPRLLERSSSEQKFDRWHWRMLKAEPLLGIGVVVAAGLLVTFPLPPRQLGEADREPAKATACDPCPLPLPKKDELAIAEHAGSRLIAAWIRHTPTGLAGEVRGFDVRGNPLREPVTITGAKQKACGSGCWRFTTKQQSALRVAVTERGRRYTAVLPVTWVTDGTQRARQLLEGAQATMRSLSTVRETEQVTSGPGSFARTDYVLKAPDRLRYRTDGRVENVTIGKRSWQRVQGGSWQRQRSDGLAFRTRSWFRWTPYARVIRLLAIRTEGGRYVAELALMDPGTPVWQYLTIDLRTKRVLRQRLITNGHFMMQRFFAFNRPVQIRPPTTSPK